MIIAIVGPTGVGKTKLSIELAKRLNAIIINCDAVQVYKELDIGSAKIKKEEMENIPHFLIDFLNISDNYSVCDYQRDGRKIIDNNKDKNIIIVGGTGLYLKALLYSYNFSTDISNNTYDNLSNEELYEKALLKDPNMNIHINNRKRLINFLNKDTVINELKPLYDVIYIGLTTNRDNLYNIINKRVDEMFLKGLEKEAESLFLKYPNAKILSTAIGYKEFIPYFNKEYSLEEVKNKIKQNSRHYAKRQYTWFNNQMDINWFDTNYDNFSETIEKIDKFIKKC